MNRIEKSSVVADVAERYSSNGFAFFVTFDKVSVSQLMLQRSKMMSFANALVVKNTLNKIASNSTGFSHASEFMKGQVMTVFTLDPVSTAKSLMEFKSENESVKILGYSDKLSSYGPEKVLALSKLPSVDQLRSGIISSLISVQRNILTLSSEVQKGLIRLINAKYINL